MKTKDLRSRSAAAARVIDSGASWKPYPELVDQTGHPYEIVDSRDMPGLPTTGLTDKVDRVLWVPLDRSGRPVSLHELSHVLWSPLWLDVRVARACMLAVEDARVNLGLAHVGLALSFDDKVRDEVGEIARRDLEAGALGMLVLRAVASLGTNVAPALRALIPETGSGQRTTLRDLVVAVHGRLARARRRNRDAVASPKQTLRIARWLARELAKRGIAVPTDHGRILFGCCGDRAGSRGRGVRGAFTRLRGRLRDGIRPGRLRIVAPPLPVARRRPVDLGPRRHRAATEGTQLRYLHRFGSDQCVFKRTQRPTTPRGGTLLIDTSSSMRLTPERLGSIIDEATTADLVALYAGDGERGQLRIVARDGRRAAASDLRSFAHGNVVDLPALQWLCGQPRPRVWLSDGAVTGCEDISTDAITKRCREVCRDAGIVMVKDASKVIGALGPRGGSRSGTAVARRAAGGRDPLPTDAGG